MTVTQTISTDTALQLLADQQRRRVLQHLVESEGSVRIDQLPDIVFANDPSWNESDELGHRFMMELHHVHLPTRQAAGLIGYDPSSGEIKYRSDDKLEAILEACS